jgi:hypothetical protein
MDEIIPNLFIGDKFDAEKLGNAEGWLIIAVTEYENEIPNEPSEAIRRPFMRGDLADTAVLDEIGLIIGASIHHGKKVLVHCVHAHERSPLAIAWYLVQHFKAKDLNEAYDMIIAKHPTAVRRLYWLPFNARPYPYNGDVFQQ